jgi:hypothetical protein
MRKQLASLSFSDKIQILEKLRDRSLALGAAGLRAHAADKAQQLCNCADWQACGCGHQPPYHCKWCCRELTEAQIIAAKRRGFYQEEKR